MSVKNRVKKICVVCNKEFEKTPGYLKHSPARYCSFVCAGKGRSLGLTKIKPAEILHLKCEECGKEYDKLRKLVGRLPRKYCSRECSSKARAKGIKTRSNSIGAMQQRAHRRRKYHVCAICGFDRFVEGCHIHALTNGGKQEEANIIYLCPNHHRLFDNRLLKNNELKKLPALAFLKYKAGLSDPYSKLRSS